MAQATLSIEQRIERFRQAADRARDLKRGTTLTAKPMAELIGVSWDVLRGWCNTLDGFEKGADFVRGQAGKPWVFKPLKSINWLIKHFSAAQKAQQSEAAAQIKKAVGNDVEPPRTAMSVRDMRDLLVLNREVTDEKVRQGKLADVDQLVSVLQTVFSAMQAAGLETQQKLDPNGKWPPETRAVVDEAIREMMIEQERAAQLALGAF